MTMRISDVIGFCFSNLFRRKLRTFLTVAGIMLGTCSIVLTLAFSYTTSKNIEEAMKTGADLTKIVILRQKYNPNKGNKGKDIIKQKLNTYETDDSLDFGDELIAKLSKIDGVDFVFPQKKKRGILTFNVGKEYLADYVEVLGVNFRNVINLEKMGYKLLTGEFLSNASHSKTKNVVVGALFPYNFHNMKAKTYSDAYRSPYDVFYGDSKDIEPFFDLEKAKIQAVVLNSKGRKQLEKMSMDLWSKIGSGEVSDSEDETDESGAVDIDSLSGDHFMLKVTGWFTDYDFDIRARKWDKLKEDMSAGGGDYWNRVDRMSSVLIDLETFKELEKIADKYEQSQGFEGTKKKGFAYDDIFVMAKDWNDVGPIVQFIHETMNYRTESLLGDIKEKQKQTEGIRAMLGALGIITVVVSALGIANMMFMSISERTKEIGIMKVLGCNISSIRGMFLMEAGVVGLVGGIIGVASSFGIAKGLSKLMSYVSTDEFIQRAASSQYLSKILEGTQNFAAMFNLVEGRDVVSIPVYLLIGGVIFGTIVGFVSGLAPANRAVKISALAAIKQD